MLIRKLHQKDSILVLPYTLKASCIVTHIINDLAKAFKRIIAGAQGIQGRLHNNHQMIHILFPTRKEFIYFMSYKV